MFFFRILLSHLPLMSQLFFGLSPSSLFFLFFFLNTIAGASHVLDPHHEVWKPQFSSGDQTDESRIPFFNSGFAACPSCGEKNIWRFEEKAGVKPNGDTFGTEVFLCQTKGCGWSTSFMYDDGGDNLLG